MDLFTYLLGKKGQNTQKDLFSYLLGKKSSTSGFYTTYTGQTFNIANTVRAKIKNWILGGNTEQDIEPTPDNPQEIHIVKGNNSINITNKNIIELNSFTENTDYILNTDDTITVTKNYGSAGRIYTNSINLKAGTYTFSYVPNLTGNLSERFSIANLTTSTNIVNQNLTIVNDQKTTYTFILTEPSEIAFCIMPNQATSGTLTLKELMLEQGSTATEYEKYQIQNYPINLPIENLFDVSLLPITKNGVTLSIDNDGNLVLNGTPDITSGYINFIPSPNVILKPNTYTISMNEIKDGIGIYFGNIGSSQINMGDLIKERTFTLNQTESGTFGINVRYNIGTLTNYILNAQLEEGTIANSYNKFGIPALELCKIGDYQDEIKASDGTNLFDKNNANILNAYFASPDKRINTSQSGKMFYISCKNNTTYTISKIASERFRVMTTETIPEIGVVGIDYAQKETGTYITITTSSNAHYLCVYYYLNGTDTLSEQEILDSIQVEYGSQVTEYQPYGKNTWYIKKNINKVILNGTESGFDTGYVNDSTYGTFLVNHTVAFNTTDEIKALCNYLNGNTPNEIITNQQVGISTRRGISRGLFMRVPTTIANDLTSFLQWLSEVNPIVYYVLSNPTYTVITDTNLISQLNALLNSRSYNDLTNIEQTNEDLPFNISVDVKVSSVNLGVNNSLNNSFLSNKTIIEDEDIEQDEIENQIYSEGE